MRKITNEEVREMSQTKEGALNAVILKYEWLLCAAREEVLEGCSDCGLCLYYNCYGSALKPKCPLNSCASGSLYKIIIKGFYALQENNITLIQFRVLIKWMLEKLETIKKEL